MILTLVLTLATLHADVRGATSAPSREALLRQADLALHDRRFGQAAALYRRAADLDPQAGDAVLMAAVAEFQLGQYQRVRFDLDRAAARDLSPEDRELARTYLELLEEASPAPAESTDTDAPDFTATVVTSVGGGYDSNPNRSGPLDSDAAVGQPFGTGFGTGAIELGLSGTPWSDVQLDIDYTLEQSAQLDRGRADLDYQDHLLELTLRRQISAAARLDMTLAGELSFMGVATALHPFSNSARADVDLTLGAGAVKLRVGGGYQATRVLDAQLSFLGGHRVEVRATPTMQFAGWRASATARLRQEILDAARGPTFSDEDASCETCTTTVIPYSNRSASFGLRLKAPADWLFRPGAWVRVDGRAYENQATIEQSTAGTVMSRTDLGRRATMTRALGMDLRVNLTESIALTARWDFSRFVGVFQPASAVACASHEICGEGPLADRRYDKHNLGLQLEIEWL